MLIEQAVFTSAKTDWSQGYQLVAASAGIRDVDTRELVAWGPSHDSLISDRPDASSVNFHPLPSGAWCASKTTAAGPEYSGRGGSRVYTQCLVVPPEVLARFANNPFALLRKAWVNKLLVVHDQVPSPLCGFELPGLAEGADEGLLAQFVEQWGPRRVAWMVQSVLKAQRTVVLGARNAEALLAGLLNCFPVGCRGEISFATGLKFSPRRSFRVQTLSADAAERRHLQRQHDLAVVDLAEEPTGQFEPEGWAAFVSNCILDDRLSDLASEPAQSIAPLRLADLSAFAEQLGRAPQPLTPSRNDQSRRAAHAAHIRPSPAGSRPASHAEEKDIGNRATLVGPSVGLGAEAPQEIERLEQLDDLIYDTITGKRNALELLSKLWREAMAELPRSMIEQSREQYLQYALKLWEMAMTHGLRDPERAVAVLDVLCVVFDER